MIGFVEAPGRGLELPLDITGTAFQQRVWQALRAIPMKPVWASGMSACAASTMPSPARSTGTSSGGSANRYPTVRATGVCSGADTSAASRVAS